MTLLRRGDVGAEVRELQRLLRVRGARIDLTGAFDDTTAAAVVFAQTRYGLVVDGVAGPKTMLALQLDGRIPGHLGAEDLRRAAATLDVKLAAVRAVNEVESQGPGFLPDGRPVILFERHIMYRQLRAAGHDADQLARQYPNIVNPVRGGYMGKAAEHMRLAQAAGLDQACALASASWGMFQIMGFNYALCGFTDVDAFTRAQCSGADGQLESFSRFIARDRFLIPLRTHDWAKFAEGYNGPAYAKNQYDKKLATAFAAFSEAPAGAAVGAAKRKPRKSKKAVVFVKGLKPKARPQQGRPEFAAVRAPRKQPFRRTVKPDPVDLRDYVYRPPISIAPPASLMPGKLRPVMNQGDTQACTGFSLATSIEYLLDRGKRQVEPLSGYMLYSMARRYDEWADEGDETDSGSSLRGALKGWFNHGVCLENDWPYGDPNVRPRYGYAQRAVQTPLGVYFRVELKSITDLQAAIQQVGAVYVSAFTHDGWDQVPITRVPVKGHADLPVIPFGGRPSQTGGHAFALVGFNQHGFVMQNSWGRNWGAGGFAVLTYADWLANGMDAWVVALGVSGVLAGRISPHDGGGAAAAAAGGANTSLWWSEEQAYQHSVVLGNDGRVKRYLTEDEINRSLLHQVAGLPDQWFRTQPAQAPKRLVIYAHGGLNSEADAIRRARALGRHFVANGCYPLFLVWKTGLMEIIGNRITDAWRLRPAAAAAGAGEWITDRTDLLIEKTIGREAARPIWSEMKENAGHAFGNGRGGDLLVTALQKLRATWGDDLEVHLVGHSAGSIILGHLLSSAGARQSDAMIRSVHLYAPACTVQFANQHYAPNERLMKQLYIDLLSDRVERNDQVAAIYRKSLLYLVSNALEIDLRTPILGLENAFKEDYGGWDGTSSTNEALRAWRDAAENAGLHPGNRLGVYDEDKMVVALPDKSIPASHGGFDNDVPIIGRTLERIAGAPLKAPPDDLRGF